MADKKNEGKGAAARKGAPPEVTKNPNAKLHNTMPAPEVKTVPGTEKKPKKRAVKAGSMYVLLKELEDGTKMPLQCKQIITCLSKAEGKKLNREELLKAMVAFPIVTRQPMERILGFYQSRLVSGNWVRIEAIAEVKPVKEDKAAKTEETAGPATIEAIAEVKPVKEDKAAKTEETAGPATAESPAS